MVVNTAVSSSAAHTPSHGVSLRHRRKKHVQAGQQQDGGWKNDAYIVFAKDDLLDNRGAAGQPVQKLKNLMPKLISIRPHT